MADIIRLEDRRNETLPPPAKDVVAAQVLLFTGVRYERLDPPTRRPGSGAGTKRPSKSTKRG